MARKREERRVGRNEKGRREQLGERNGDEVRQREAWMERNWGGRESQRASQARG